VTMARVSHLFRVLVDVDVVLSTPFTAILCCCAIIGVGEMLASPRCTRVVVVEHASPPSESGDVLESSNPASRPDAPKISPCCFGIPSLLRVEIRRRGRLIGPSHHAVCAAHPGGRGDEKEPRGGATRFRERILSYIYRLVCTHYPVYFYPVSALYRGGSLLGVRSTVKTPFSA